jgi:hypothetical protein
VGLRRPGSGVRRGGRLCARAGGADRQRAQREGEAAGFVPSSAAQSPLNPSTHAPCSASPIRVARRTLRAAAIEARAWTTRARRPALPKKSAPARRSWGPGEGALEHAKEGKIYCDIAYLICNIESKRFTPGAGFEQILGEKIVAARVRRRTASNPPRRPLSLTGSRPASEWTEPRDAFARGLRSATPGADGMCVALSGRCWRAQPRTREEARA